MVGRSGKSKAARHCNNMRKKNRRDNEHLDFDKKVIEDVDDGCLFIRAFGTAREVVNITRILSGMPSVLIERDDKRTPLSVEIQGEAIDKLLETIEQLGPELKQLCLSKSKSTCDKTKHTAKTQVPATAVEKTPSYALVPLRRGRAISSNSLHLTASGRAMSLSSYIRVLSGLPKDKSKQQNVETLDIEGENLEELLVCLEKLGSSFKKRPRPSFEETLCDCEREESLRRNGRRTNQGRTRTGLQPPRCVHRRRRQDHFEDEIEMIGAGFLSFLLRGLFF